MLEGRPSPNRSGGPEAPRWATEAAQALEPASSRRSSGWTTADPHEASAVRAVEVAGAHEDPATARPSSSASAQPSEPALGHRDPQVEGALGQGHVVAEPAEARRTARARGVARRAGPSTCASSPSATAAAAWTGPGTISPACWRSLGEVVDTSSGRRRRSRPARPARFERFDSECTATHARRARLEDRAGRTGPGELGVALVGEHQHPVRRPHAAAAARSSSRPVGFDGEFDPQQERPLGVPASSVSRAMRPVVDRDRHRPAARRAARPSRRSGRRSPGTAPCRGSGSRRREVVRPSTRRTPWCPRTRRRASGVDRDPESPRQPVAARPRGRRRAPARPGSPRSAPRRASAATTASGGGSHGVPIEQSTMPPAVARQRGARAAARRS